MKSGLQASSESPTGPSISVRPFGVTHAGVPVEEYTLTNGEDMSTSILTWGGIVRTLFVPDRNGKVEDVVLGFDTLPDYEERHPWFGPITGRFANRIAKGRFVLDGIEYKLAINNGPNHLHGGVNGFDRAVWQARTERTDDYARLILSHRSPDGDEGYPGEVGVEVRYTLHRDNSLAIDYLATTTKPTPINLTNHSYFNLSGDPSQSVLGHRLHIGADRIVEVDETQIPTGNLPSVAGTAYDFLTPHALGDMISQVGIGYDHTYVLSDVRRTVKFAARVLEPRSGRVLDVETTEPGVQLYTGNYLDGSLQGKAGLAYQKHAGFCLETQHFPDSVNQPGFPSVILRPGDVYNSTTIFRFSTTATEL
jgi:aldose 1-epimerase